MCNQNNDLSVNIVNEELGKAVKVKQIRDYIKRISGKTIYSLEIEGNNLTVQPFKSEQAVERVEAQILEILGDMCENLNSHAGTHCSDLYNCCDCGGNNCGCAYCWSCHACWVCLDEE